MQKLEDPAGLSMRTAMVPMVSMFAFQLLATASILTLPVFAVPMARDMDVPASWVGFYMSVVAMGAMCGGVFGGQMVRRLGAVRVAQICLGMSALALVAMTSGVALVVVLATVLVGFAYGPPTPTSSHLLARTTPARLMPLVFSVKQTAVPAGGALAGVLVPPMVLFLGWQGAAAAMAALCVAVALGLHPLRRQLDGDRDPTVAIWGDVLSPLRVVLGSARLRRMALVSFSFSAVQMSLIAYLVTYLMEGIGLDLVTAGMVLAVTQLSGVFGRVFWGTVCGGWLPPRRLLVVLGVAMAGASLVTAQFGPDWPLAALYVTSAVFGASAIGWNGVFLAEIARISPSGQVGLVAGGTVFVTFAGVVVGPMLASLLIVAGFGYASGFWMLALFALCGAALLSLRWPADPQGAQSA